MKAVSKPRDGRRAVPLIVHHVAAQLMAIGQRYQVHARGSGTSSCDLRKPARRAAAGF